MAGLLDFDFNDPQQAGLLALASGLLSAGAPQTRRVGIGEALAGGLGAMGQAQQNAQLMQRKKAAEDLAMQMHQMQFGQMQQQIKDQEAARQRAAMMPELIAKFGNDYQGMIRAGVDPAFVKNLAESQNYGRPEVSRVEEISGANGEKLKQQFDKYGNRVGDALNGYVAPERIDLNDRIIYSLPTAGASFKKGMSAAEKDTSARGWAGLQLQRDQMFEPKWNNDVGAFIAPPSKLNPQGQKIDLAGFQKPAKPMTEDQAKASGWLAQAENAWNNMKAAGTNGVDKNGNFIIKSAAEPGANDVIGKIPFAGGLANYMRGEDRQKFLQAASSLSESALRAATGAGMNEYEARQKVAEMTPQIGDGEAVIQQKFKAIPLFIEGLKMRAGSGAPQVQNILNNFNKSSPNGWKIEKVEANGQ